MKTETTKPPLSDSTATAQTSSEPTSTKSKVATSKPTTTGTTVFKLITFLLTILAAYLLSQSSALRTSLTKATAPLLTRTLTTTAPPTNMTTPRTIQKVVKALSQSEGAGARVRRSIGTPQLRNFSPFLMLDHFTISPGAGFPDHPHRGQETITYLLSGSVNHEDFAGHAGTIGPGDLQFMTAGRGIVHAEMPGDQTPSADGSIAENVGMQLWVDLPTDLKFCEPRYRDLRAEEIPIASSGDGKVSVKVISGEALGVESLKDLAYTPVWFLDITIKEGGELFQKIPQGWNSFAYTLSGETEFSNSTVSTKRVPEYHTVVFGREADGEGVRMKNVVGSGGDARIILVAGMVLDQPVVQYGPFVLNTQDQVYEALRDYQMSTNGFERARGWRSEIGKSMA